MVSNTANKYKELKKVMLQTFLFLSILWLIRIFIGELIPYHLGGRELSEKILHLENESKQVDILFLGSSRVRRGIIPKRFDSLLSRHMNQSAISFNMGGPAASVGENLYLLRHFSTSEAGANLKTIVIEWMGDYIPGSEYYKTGRAQYWMDMESFRQQAKLLGDTPGWIGALKQGKLFYLTSAFLYRNFGLGRIRNYFMDNLAPDTTLNVDRGYARKFDRHARLLSSGTADPGKAVYDPLQAGRDRENAMRIHSLADIDHVAQDLTIWLTLIRQYKVEGIRLILLIPPGQVSARQIALARRIPTEHLLDLSNPNEYPDLYDPEIFFDFVHLNHEGAQRFTEHVAQAFLNDRVRILKP